MPVPEKEDPEGRQSQTLGKEVTWRSRAPFGKAQPGPARPRAPHGRTSSPESPSAGARARPAGRGAASTAVTRGGTDVHTHRLQDAQEERCAAREHEGWGVPWWASQARAVQSGLSAGDVGVGGECRQTGCRLRGQERSGTSRESAGPESNSSPNLTTQAIHPTQRAEHPGADPTRGRPPPSSGKRGAPQGEALPRPRGARGTRVLGASLCTRPGDAGHALRCPQTFRDPRNGVGASRPSPPAPPAVGGPLAAAVYT